MRQYQYGLAICFFFLFSISYAEEIRTWEYSFIKGLNYEEKGDIEKAIEELEISRSLSEEVVILRELGYCYGRIGEFVKAEKCYEKVLEKFPEDSNALKNLELIQEILKKENQK